MVEGATQNETIQIAETVRRAIETTPFIDPATGTDCGTVTVSLGLCMADMADTTADLYHKSDMALYGSKKAGRNRCTMFDEALQDKAAGNITEPRIVKPEPIIYRARSSRISTG